MSRNGIALLVLLVSPVLTSAQPIDEAVQSEVELVSALCRFSADDRSRENLLKSHPQFVNSQLWAALIKRASAEYYGPAREQSFRIYEIALIVADRLQRPNLLATTSYNIGRSYSGLNQLSKAVEAYERSRAIFEQAGLQRDLTYTLADLGRLYFILEEYEKARSYSEQSLRLANSSESEVIATEPAEDFARATSLATLADLHLRDGDYDQAIEKFGLSLALHKKLSHQNAYYNSFIADDLQALGRVFTASGDYTQALAYLNQALSIVNNLSDRNRMANLLNSIGVLYLEQEDYAQAKKTLDSSLQIYLSINQQREVAEVLLNLAVIEQRQSNYDQAISFFQRSMRGARAARLMDVEIAAGEGIGAVLTAQKKLTEALAILSESLELARKTQNKTREIEINWRSAQTLQTKGDLTEAANRAESAVLLARTGRLPKLEYLATTTLGHIYLAQGKIELAKETLIRATQQLERLREHVAGRETASQLYFEDKLASYHSLIDILVRQDKPTEALLYAERAKARVLLDVVSGNRIDISKGLTDIERNEQARLNRKIAGINDRLKEQQSSSGSKDLYSHLDAARLEYQAYQDSIYVKHPDLRLRSGRTAVLTAADFKDLIFSSTAYLEYVITTDRVLLFVTTRDESNNGANIKVYPLGIEPSRLREKVNSFHDRLANRHPDYSSLARELYSLLLSPAEKQLKSATLCIVPDSFLWNLPFQALMTQDERFLVEAHGLYYAPSLSALREMKRNGSTINKANASLIAFGNPVIGKDKQRNEELCPLPEAETEVNSIARSFSPVGRKVFIGREASEKSFRTLAPTYLSIHLATHGIIDNRQPLYSHLLLTKTEGDVENDGLLEAREIMNMDLKADLAVLSACETANGRISPGEGVMGMSWAFFVAGTRSMLVSQWKVNSVSTSQLMANFYQSLEASRKKFEVSRAEALREAALKTMRNPSYRHPFYWVGFVLVGSIE